MMSRVGKYKSIQGKKLWMGARRIRERDNGKPVQLNNFSACHVGKELSLSLFRNQKSEEED